MLWALAGGGLGTAPMYTQHNITLDWKLAPELWKRLFRFASDDKHRILRFAQDDKVLSSSVSPTLRIEREGWGTQICYFART
jgi:hypothetical protein